MLTQNPPIISEYLHQEASLGRMQCLPPESIHKGVLLVQFQETEAWQMTLIHNF